MAKRKRGGTARRKAIMLGRTGRFGGSQGYLGITPTLRLKISRGKTTITRRG